MLTNDNREKLKSVSTATLSTVLFKRGLRNAFMMGPKLMNEASCSMVGEAYTCLLYTSPSPRDISGSRMPSSA